MGAGKMGDLKRKVLLIVVSLVIVFGWGSPASEGSVAHSQVSIPVLEENPMADKLKVTVATYNIHHGKSVADKLNLEDQIELLRALNADIIGLQEVEKMSPRSGFKNQAQEIAEALGMHHSFAPALSIGPWEYGNVLLSRHPILEVQTFSLPSDKENRNALLAALEVEERPVWVLVTHLGLNGKERQAHIEQLAESLQQVKGPLLVLGDFNAEADAPELKPWLETLQPASTERQVTFPALGRQIDHILHSEHFTAGKTYTAASEASDHVPLISELEL